VTFSETDAGHVVVAEANPATAGALSWLLREHGYSVTTVGDRDELFAALARNPPDLVLIDGDAVRRDGALLEELRADQRLHDLRVIVTAPWASIEDGGYGLPWGADDCVSKPFRVPELLGRVRTQLRASGQLRAAREALQDTAAELERAREDAANNRRLVDILHEVTGEVSATEIYRILARRVARALEISHCSVILARPGEEVGTVAAAVEDSMVQDAEIRIAQYPEIGAALETGRPILVEDMPTHHPPVAQRDQRVPGRVSRETAARAAIQSVAAIPFVIDRRRSGVFFLRTDHGERRLGPGDVTFADVVIRAAVAAIRRAQALETTRADNRRLEALATTDPLTRVLNRRALLDRLTAEVDRARRFSSSLSLLLLDVDHFKDVNDTAGHLAGDSVLRQLGALLEEAVRKVDVVARYGGEEFVAILPGTSVEGGVVFAERLRERVAEQAFDIGGAVPLHLTVSIGIASFPSARVLTTEDLFARADEALYRAKSGGRNQVCS
jgi:two-component system cell cycle response regulator